MYFAYCIYIQAINKHAFGLISIVNYAPHPHRMAARGYKNPVSCLHRGDGIMRSWREAYAKYII